MTVLINDHSGHPFQIQLSRELSKKGLKVIHTYSANFQTPKGNLNDELDNNNLEIIPIYYDTEFNKYSITKRRKQEIEFADKLIQQIRKYNPQVLISSNTPLFAQDKILKYCKRENIKFIFWCQDIYSVGLEKVLIKKLGFLAKPIGFIFKRLEKKLLHKSDFVINITEDFNAVFLKWGIPLSKIEVIPNWAPIEEIPVIDKNNNWARQFGLNNKYCITYSGTLGLKHNPSLLSDLAKHFKNQANIQIVVISEGLGAEYLKEKKQSENLDNLLILPFQIFSEMPAVMGSADILLAILEPDAGIFSVPSKVLTYLCSGKPVILSVPTENLSSKIIVAANAGIAVTPNDTGTLIKACESLLNNRTLSKQLGENGRSYAEKNFEIKSISEKFINIIKHLKVSS